MKYLDSKKIENFNVWDFTERVADERFITLKKNFKWKANETASWSVETNNMRVRVPPKWDRNKMSSEGVFLFIGDSVPFGWGNSAEDTVPSILSRKLPSLEFVNGAIPSYSLFQATKRFEYEFKQIANIKYIYLQIYDPVSQYALNGSNWEESDNWYTFSDKQFNGCKFSESAIFKWVYNKSNFVYLLNRIYRENVRCWVYSPPNQNSDLRLENHIRNSLDLLKKNAPKDAEIIVAPVTPSPTGLLKYNEDYKHSIRMVNGALKNVSNDLGFKFMNTQELLNRQEYFIDECCHLSKKGAEKVAKEILNNLPKERRAAGMSASGDR